MTTTNGIHIAHEIWLVPISFYLLNRKDSKRIIEYCLKEGYMIKDFTYIENKDIKLERISCDFPCLVLDKKIFIHINKRPLIVNTFDKGLMAVVEILKINGE
jgi:hypothetical protein